MSTQNPTRGDEIKAADLNALKKKADQLGSLNVSPPLVLSDTPSGPLIGASASFSSGPFYARLTDRVGTAYGWKEVHLVGGTWLDVLGGRTGTPTSTPAYEANLASDLPVGAVAGVVVELQTGYGTDDYRFVFYRHDPFPAAFGGCGTGPTPCIASTLAAGQWPATLTVSGPTTLTLTYIPASFVNPAQYVGCGSISVNGYTTPPNCCLGGAIPTGTISVPFSMRLGCYGFLGGPVGAFANYIGAYTTSWVSSDGRFHTDPIMITATDYFCGAFMTPPYKLASIGCSAGGLTFTASGGLTGYVPCGTSSTTSGRSTAALTSCSPVNFTLVFPTGVVNQGSPDTFTVTP